MSYGEQLDAVLEDAAKRLSEMYDTDPAQSYGAADLTWHAWPQVWGDTTCGHSGCGGQMITTAITVIASLSSRDIHVYHAGRLAYVVQRPGKAFWAAALARGLVGATGDPSKYEEVSDA